MITQMRERVLKDQMIGGEHNGQHAFIPRISLTPSTGSAFAFRFRRRQFAVRLAFAQREGCGYVWNVIQKALSPWEGRVNWLVISIRNWMSIVECSHLGT